MSNIILNPKVAVFIGFLAVLPFMFMEWINASNLPRSNFPIQIFIALWIEAVIFILLLGSMANTLRRKNILGKDYIYFLLKAIFSGMIAWAWITLILDQIPCFLGATGC